MKHKKNTRRNKSHKGRKILLTKSEIRDFIDVRTKERKQEWFDKVTDIGRKKK